MCRFVHACTKEKGWKDTQLAAHSGFVQEGAWVGCDRDWGKTLRPPARFYVVVSMGYENVLLSPSICKGARMAAGPRETMLGF